MTPPRLTDRAALLRNRQRAQRMTAPALFLLAAAADEIEERLAEVNRRFSAPALIGGFPEYWAQKFPCARIVSDAPVLGLRPGAHDLVLHAMCLHWADDPVGQLVQARQALKPDGMFLALLFGGRTLSELRSTLGQAEVEIDGGLSPRVAPMAEIRDLGSLLQRAGFALPVADSHVRRVRYRDALHLMHDLRAMGETNALAARRRIPPSRQFFRRTEELYRSHFAAPEGGVMASFEIVALTGWAPGPGQPRALRPGSATRRLADALGTPETSLPDRPKD